jgi:hypothetical protein
MKANVYIVHDLGKLNFEPAAEFGELVICVTGHVNPSQLPRAIQRLQAKLAKVKPEDYVVAAGHPALIAMAGALQVEETGSLKMLCWDNQSNAYAPVEVQVYEND